MADKKISALTGASTPLAGTEVLPIVQGGSTVKVAVSDLTAGRAVATGAQVATGSITTTYSGTGAGRFILDRSGTTFQSDIQFRDVGVSKWAVGQGVATVGNNLDFYNYTLGGNALSLASNSIVTMAAYGAGAATFSATGVISSVSDETWKVKDGVPVDTDSMLKKLEPGYWYYNDEKKEIFGNERQLGFYAQNVNVAIGQEAAPFPTEITKLDDTGTQVGTGKFRPWGYYDRSVLAVTVMSLQKALATIETLTARITALETA